MTIDHESICLTAPSHGCCLQSVLDRRIGRIEQLLKMQDTIAICLELLISILNDQGARGTYGLKADVGMIEISPRRTIGNGKFVVKEMRWWDSPLGGQRRPITKRSCCLGKTMPML